MHLLADVRREFRERVDKQRRASKEDSECEQLLVLGAAASSGRHINSVRPLQIRTKRNRDLRAEETRNLSRRRTTTTSSSSSGSRSTREVAAGRVRPRAERHVSFGAANMRTHLQTRGHQTVLAADHRDAAALNSQLALNTPLLNDLLTNPLFRAVTSFFYL